LKASWFNKNLQRPQETHQTKGKFVQYPQRACYVCGSLDHLIRDCTDPRRRKQKESTEKNAGYIGRAAETVSDDTTNEETNKAIALVVKKVGRQNGLWIADSGCNKHILV